MNAVIDIFMQYDQENSKNWVARSNTTINN